MSPTRVYHAVPKMGEGRWLLIVLAAFVLLYGPGRIEGRVFPTAEPMVLTKAEALQMTLVRPDGARESIEHTLFWGHSARLRDACSWRAFDWNLGDRTGNSVPVTIRTRVPRLRDPGPFDFGPWEADIPVAEFGKTYADVLHRCRVPVLGWPLPWLTRTPFWN